MSAVLHSAVFSSLLLLVAAGCSSDDSQRGEESFYVPPVLLPSIGSGTFLPGARGLIWQLAIGNQVE